MLPWESDANVYRQGVFRRTIEDPAMLAPMSFCWGTFWVDFDLIVPTPDRRSGNTIHCCEASTIFPPSPGPLVLKGKQKRIGARGDGWSMMAVVGIRQTVPVSATLHGNERRMK
jgi:hypothetical protein